jgi:uncharacterized RDD family membrane protein YckC
LSHSRFDIADWSDEAALTEGVLTRRLVAFLIDGVLVTLLCWVLFAVLVLFGVLTLGLGLPLLSLIPLVPIAYNWLSLLRRASATPGQALLGLRVRRDADLGPPSGLQALAWSLGFTVTCGLGFIWFAVALVTVRHRALHDLVSGLVVVRAGATSALTGPGRAWKTGAGGPAFE